MIENKQQTHRYFFIDIAEALCVFVWSVGSVEYSS